MKKLKLTIMMVLLPAIFGLTFLGCTSDAPSDANIKNAILDYTSNHSSYADLLAVGVIEVGQPFVVNIMGREAKYYPVKVYLDYPSSRKLREFTVYKNEYGEWQATLGW